MTDRHDRDDRSGPGPSQGVSTPTVGEPDTPATSGRRRRWWVRPLALVIGLVVVVYVPVPVLTWWQQRQAAEAIDLVTQDRADALAVLAGERPALEVLGDPVRAWSGVDGHLRPRYSDGDGQAWDIVLWWQVCLARAYEVYELPPDHGTVDQTAALVGGKVGFRKPACTVPVLDVLSIGDGSRDEQWRTMSLRWVDTRPEAPDDGEPCTVAAPGDGTLIRVETTVDQELPPGQYLVLRVGAARSAPTWGANGSSAGSGPAPRRPKAPPTSDRLVLRPGNRPRGAISAWSAPGPVRPADGRRR